MSQQIFYDSNCRRRRRAAAFLASLSLLLLIAASCGKRRPPLPPLENIPQRTEELSAAQQGNQIILDWPAPRRNANDASVQSIRRIDVYRLAEPLNAPLPLTEDEFAARSTLIGSVPLDPASAAAAGSLTYADALELRGQPTRLRYAIRFVNASNQRAAFSNFVIIEPSARVARPPALRPPSQNAPERINVTWEAPAANIDASTPANVLGYNIYRAEGAGDEFVKLNETPLAATDFADSSFVFGTRYRYLVRTVSLGTGAAPVESLDSNVVAFEPRDTFAPPAPDNVTVVAAPQRISLFFPASVAPDIAGYNIYRSTDPQLPLAGWNKLTPALYGRTTFIDDTVTAGVKYYYYVTAVDTSGNASAPSAIISETAP